MELVTYKLWKTIVRMLLEKSQLFNDLLNQIQSWGNFSHQRISVVINISQDRAK